MGSRAALLPCSMGWAAMEGINVTYSELHRLFDLAVLKK